MPPCSCAASTPPAGRFWRAAARHGTEQVRTALIHPDRGRRIVAGRAGRSGHLSRSA